MKTVREFLRFHIIPFIFLLGILLTGVFTVFYTIVVRTQDGELVRSNWPKTFTVSFSKYISSENDTLSITDDGKKLLDQNKVWLQILDKHGVEVLNYAKPDTVPFFYEPYELLESYQNGIGDFSVFVSTVDLEGISYTYLVGFPISISKVVTYIDRARYDSGRVLIITIIVLTAVLVVMMTLYSYKSFCATETRRLSDEKAKEEWLANITHDLKTPLAPIRGYAELLAEQKQCSMEETKRYGTVILKNALYTEQLVDDLKLTYQLQSNMFPLKKERQNIVRFMKEIVIDILNTPEYESRRISFDCNMEELYSDFDEKLLRRAFTNIIANALKHNVPDTEIRILITFENEIEISISDNGSGMTKMELDGLFNRYYRGASTEVKTEGTGLGMAIAKQIVDAHGGKINAKSVLGTGTMIKVQLPK